MGVKEIVLGLDDSPAARAALQWAAGQACPVAAIPNLRTGPARRIAGPALRPGAATLLERVLTC